jgi:hypothetical protein
VNIGHGETEEFIETARPKDDFAHEILLVQVIQVGARSALEAAPAAGLVGLPDIHVFLLLEPKELVRREPIPF